MDLEVFKGCTTFEEAVTAGMHARLQRLQLLADLRGDGTWRGLLDALPAKEAHSLANQISVAVNMRNGIAERMARRLEQVLEVPYGFLDRPFPKRDLALSMNRAWDFAKLLETYRLDLNYVRCSKMSLAQLKGGVTGERGVPKALYDEVVKNLKPKGRAKSKPKVKHPDGYNLDLED